MNEQNEKMLKIIVEALEEKKAEDIKVVKISDLTVIADYFVIAGGKSTTQIKALSEIVDEKLSREGIEPAHREGYGSGSWVLLDYSNIIVHIFHPDARSFYDLERLWADGEKIDIEKIKNS